MQVTGGQVVAVVIFVLLVAAWVYYRRRRQLQQRRSINQMIQNDITQQQVLAQVAPGQAAPGQAAQHVGIDVNYNTNFIMEFIFNDFFVSVFDSQNSVYMTSNIDGYSNYVSNRNIEYIVSFRQNAVNTQSVCCENVVGTVQVNDPSPLRILVIKTPLKNEFNVRLQTANCLKNPWFKDNGFFFGIGLIGIKKSLCSNDDTRIKQLWSNVYRFICDINDSCGLRELIEKEEYINELWNLGINVSRNDLNIIAIQFSHFYNSSNNYLTNMYNKQIKIYDSSTRLVYSYNDKYSVERGDCITLRLNRPIGARSTVSFVKNNNMVIADKHIPIKLNDYYYQYMVVSKSCDCSEEGNFKLAVSYS